MTFRAEASWRIVAVIAAALAIRLGLASVVPAFQAPDERAHLAYVEHLAHEGSLPVQPVPDLEAALRFWPQFYQPPLAYLSFVPVYAAAEALGGRQETRLRLLRLQNSIYGAIAVALVWVALARLRPGDEALRLGASGAVALLPGFAGNAAALNNDALANALLCGLWIPLLEMHRSRRARLAAGAIFGAAILTKLTVLPLTPLLLVVPWCRARKVETAVRAAVVAGSVVALLTLPLWIRNALVYGHPLAVGAGSFSFEALAALLPPERVAAFAEPAPGRALAEFVGQFGIFANLSWSPLSWAWGAIGAAALLGWLRGTATDSKVARLLPAWIAAPLLSAAGMAYFSLTYYGGWQGRYLYTAVLPLAALASIGLGHWLPPRQRGLALGILGLGLLALDLALCGVLARFYAEVPPLRWSFGGPL